MLNATVKVCVLLFVITYFSEQCYSLRIIYEHVESHELKYDEDLLTPETINYVGKSYEEPVAEDPKQPEDYLFNVLLGKNLELKKKDDEDNKKDDEYEKTAVQRRVTRQAYPGHDSLYPKLPSNPPYNQYQPYNDHRSPQWQPPNNYSQHGYPSNGVLNSYPSSVQQNSTYGHNPYNPNQGQNPYNSNNPSSPSFPGHRYPNITSYNYGPNQTPYNAHGQLNNITNPGYQTPGYRPSTLTPYTPRPLYSHTTPSGRHPVVYDPNSNRPSYNNQNSSFWLGSSGSNVVPPYNASNGQNPQYFNSYPNNPNARPNSTFPHTVPNKGPYHNPANGGQYPTYNHNNAGGNSYGQNAQSFNPNNPYGSPNSTFPHTVPNQGPYHKSSNGGQYPTNNNYNASGSPYGQNVQSFNPNNPYGSSNSTFPHTVPNQRPYPNPSNRGQYPTYNHNNADGSPYGQNAQSFNPNNLYGSSNSTFPRTVPNQGPYHNPSNGGQYPTYNHYNASGSPYGQNAQSFNTNNPYGSPNSTFPHTVPNQGPYHNPLNGGQYPTYNNNNAGGSQYGQNPQSFNPNNPYGRPNSTFPHTVLNQGPYQNPSNGAQYPTYNNNNAGGNPYGQNSQTFNSYPQGSNQNPYNNNNIRYPPQASNGTAHDPTKVSPEYFSYPHY